MEKQLEQYKFDLMKAGALLIQSSQKASNNQDIRTSWDALNDFICESKNLPESMNSWRKKLAKYRKNLQNAINEQESVSGIVTEANKLSILAYQNLTVIIDGWGA